MDDDNRGISFFYLFFASFFSFFFLRGKRKKEGREGKVFCAHTKGTLGIHSSTDLFRCLFYLSSYDSYRVNLCSRYACRHQYRIGIFCPFFCVNCRCPDKMINPCLQPCGSYTAHDAYPSRLLFSQVQPFLPL